jgi:hypothetical protein
MLGQVEVDVEAAQVALLHPGDLVDLGLRKHLAAGGLLHVRQRLEALGQQAALADLLRRERGQPFPGGTRRQLDAHPALHRPAPTRHHHARQRPVRQVVARFEQGLLALHDCRLGGLVLPLHV